MIINREFHQRNADAAERLIDETLAEYYGFSAEDLDVIDKALSS